MWRARTKADRDAEAAEGRKKYEKESEAWRPGARQTHSVEKGAREYREQQEYYRQQEADKQAELQRKQAEEEAFIKMIASVQDEEEAFTPADLYEAGVAERTESSGLLAVTRFWQALVCGDGRAAYPLFEILRDGEGGVAQNLEMAGLFLYTGKLLGSQQCREYTDRSIKGPGLEVYRALLNTCHYSKKHIVNQDKKITDEILEARQREANAALDEFNLHTRSHEEMMEEVFAHSTEMNAHLEEIALAGQVEQEEHQDTGGKKCVVM